VGFEPETPELLLLLLLLRLLLLTSKMSISASDMGETTGALAMAYAANGSCPRTQPGTMVLVRQDTYGASGAISPFARFRHPTAEDFAAAGFECDKKVLDEVNAVADRYLALDGVEGCKNDTICGLPVWCCLLPGVCCLGGLCCICMRSSQKVKEQRAEHDRVLWKTNGHFKLCAAGHTSKVSMSSSVREDHLGTGAPTVTTTLVWLEITQSPSDQLTPPPSYGEQQHMQR